MIVAKKIRKLQIVKFEKHIHMQYINPDSNKPVFKINENQEIWQRQHFDIKNVIISTYKVYGYVLKVTSLSEKH